MGLFMTDGSSLDDLVAAAQKDPSNDSPAMDTILRRFENLAQKIGRNVARAEHTLYDATNGARWGLVQAVRAHKQGTNGFVSFVKIYMRGEAVRCAQAASVSQSATSFDLLSDREMENLAASVTHDSVMDLDAALSVLHVNQRELVLRRYVDDQSLGQIAADLGVTVSAVSQRLSTIHKKLAAQQERISNRFAVA